jgi:hypothetical protein
VRVVRQFDQAIWLEEATAIESDLSSLVAGLTEAQFHAPPRDGGWCVGHCIEHLLLTGHAYLASWDRVLAKAKMFQPASRSDRATAYSWWQRTVLRYAENASKLKVKAPARSVPYTRRSIERSVGLFVNMHEEMARRVASMQELDAARIKMPSPFVSWLRYPLSFSFDLVLAHERRHIVQGQNVRRKVLDGS